MIFFDVETTGLITNEALPLSQQPYIIEIGAIKGDVAADGSFKVRGEFSTFIKPPIALPEIITKITGIQDHDLREAPTFIEKYNALARFFLGEEEMLAHNAQFDLMMLVFDLRRNAKQYQFPFCPKLTDTRSFYSGKLANWGKEVRNDAFEQTHRALDDAKLLAECYFKTVGPG